MSDLPDSLITCSPEDGLDLALKLARLAVKKTQPDTGILKRLRPDYDQNAASLIAVSHVVSVHFQTIAAANRGWAASGREPADD